MRSESQADFGSRSLAPQLYSSALTKSAEVAVATAAAAEGLQRQQSQGC